MNPRFAHIPEYVEACQKQDRLRDFAFLELEAVLCGHVVKPMTARHLALLTHCGNGFVTGGDVLPEHIPQFIYVLQGGSLADEKAMRRFAVDFGWRNFKTCCDEIEAFVNATFLDSPEGGGKRGETFNSWLASLVDVLAREYGWQQREVLDLPIACVFQYLRVIRMRSSDKEPMVNKLSDEARAKGIARMMAEAKN